jgi:acetoacetyl-CoA reductase/3-oxoacyl-[acyl-carrier protein] reductase
MPTEPFRCDGHVALVTGGSRGIGRAIALALGRAGARVALTYRRRAGEAQAVVESIRAGGGEAIAVPLAVEDRDSVRRALAETRSRLGPVAILVNNAAVAQEKPFRSITDADWDLVLSVNLRGAFACAQEVLSDMLARRWGRIVNLASIGGQWGGQNQVHYAAAKAGLIGLTRSLARLYSGEGITANAVAPGLVETEMTAAELASPAGRAKVAAIPIGRVATPEEVARVVVFLASDAAGYVTGQTLSVNGGMLFT